MEFPLGWKLYGQEFYVAAAGGCIRGARACLRYSDWTLMANLLSISYILHFFAPQSLITYIQ